MAEFKQEEIIEKKRNGEKLTDGEMGYFMDSAMKSSHPDIEKMEGHVIDRSQISTMLTAIFSKGLDQEETKKLTEKMTNSGFSFPWPQERIHLVIDKRITDAMNEKICLVLAPALAAVGLKVLVFSGKSLCDTGRPLEKLESIPGFRVRSTKEEVYEILKLTGCCTVGQNENCSTADEILQKCNEITATFNYPPLIVASIVSKKCWDETTALVFDVKYGKGSTFCSKQEAEKTAQNLVHLSKSLKTSALLSSMESPVGRAVGISLEIAEAIHCLKGNGPSDVIQSACALGSELLQLIRHASKEDGNNMILGTLKNGTALRKFQSMIIHHGVASETAKYLCYRNAHSILPKAQHQTHIVYHANEGYIQGINSTTLAMIWKELSVQNNKHPGVGLTLLKKVGDKIKEGEAWVRVHHQREQMTYQMQVQLKNAISVKEF